MQTTQLAVSLPEVRDLLNKERYEDLQSDFGSLPEGDRGDPDWMSRLKVHPSSGLPEKTSANVLLMLEHDPRLAGRFKMDAFAQRIYGEAPLPWGSREYENGDFAWTDADSSGLRLYADRVLGFRSKEVIEDAFNDVLARHSYNPVTEYLEGLVWDQRPRLDTLLIDYLGAEDSAYTRTVTRKAFTAAVARAMVPGTKFDVMTILTGAQGIGKSTLLRKMARGRFNDGIRSFEGKEASELLQGRIKAYVRQHLRDPALSVDAVAAALNCSKRHLYNAFADERLSISQHIWVERVALFQRELLSPANRHCTLTELALASGFASGAHLSRLFKQHTGQTPAQFRAGVQSSSLLN